LILAA
jgi:hypothetical protein